MQSFYNVQDDYDADAMEVDYPDWDDEYQDYLDYVDWLEQSWD